MEKTLFGSYPSQADIVILEGNGVRHFIDLTSSEDTHCPKYTTQFNYMSYPIQSKKAPHDPYRFAVFITRISDLIRHMHVSESIYIHCKHGRGRVDMVATALVATMYGIAMDKAIAFTRQCQHMDLGKTWLFRSNRMSREQKMFLKKHLSPIHICSDNETSMKPFTNEQVILTIAAQNARSTSNMETDCVSRIRLPSESSNDMPPTKSVSDRPTTYASSSTSFEAYASPPPPGCTDHVWDGPSLKGINEVPSETVSIQSRKTIDVESMTSKDYTQTDLYKELLKLFRDDPDMCMTLCATGLQPIIDLSCPGNWIGKHLMYIRTNYHRGLEPQ